MSSYMYFSIRKGKGEFVPLITQSRSFSIYQSFKDYAPYEEVEELTKSTLTNVSEDINDRIKRSEKSIEEYVKLEEVIKEMDRPLDEIIEKWYEIENEISEYKDLVEEDRDVLGFINTLFRIINENEYEKDESKITHLYFGIDSGFGGEDEEEE